MRVRPLGEDSSSITYDYKNSSIEKNFLIKFQKFCWKHFLVTLYKHLNSIRMIKNLYFKFYS